MASSEESRTARIVQARARLRLRYLEHTERGAELAPKGSGPPNRHGMPKLPVGQTATSRWPVLDLGVRPTISTERWRLELRGAVTAPAVIGWSELLSLEQVEDVSDFHCVTGWSRMDVRWRGVRFSTVAALADPIDAVTHVLVHALDGYTTNVPMEEALRDDVLLVHQADGRPLPREHGGPVRMIVPRRYAWKGAKWVCGIEFLESDRRGFWEERGYSNTADPWQNDRYDRD